jgi:hypothetical protein
MDPSTIKIENEKGEGGKSQVALYPMNKTWGKEQICVHLMAFN